MQKLFCDICGREINGPKMVANIKILEETQSVLNPDKTNQKVMAISLDLCEDCTKKLQDFLNKTKNEQNKKG